MKSCYLDRVLLENTIKAFLAIFSGVDLSFFTYSYTRLHWEDKLCCNEREHRPHQPTSIIINNGVCVTSDVDGFALSVVRAALFASTSTDYVMTTSTLQTWLHKSAWILSVDTFDSAALLMTVHCSSVGRQRKSDGDANERSSDGEARDRMQHLYTVVTTTVQSVSSQMCERGWRLSVGLYATRSRRTGYWGRNISLFQRHSQEGATYSRDRCWTPSWSLTWKLSSTWASPAADLSHSCFHLQYTTTHEFTFRLEKRLTLFHQSTGLFIYVTENRVGLTTVTRNSELKADYKIL